MGDVAARYLGHGANHLVEDDTGKARMRPELVRGKNNTACDSFGLQVNGVGRRGSGPNRFTARFLGYSNTESKAEPYSSWPASGTLWVNPKTCRTTGRTKKRECSSQIRYAVSGPRAIHPLSRAPRKTFSRVFFFLARVFCTASACLICSSICSLCSRSLSRRAVFVRGLLECCPVDV